MIIKLFYLMSIYSGFATRKQESDYDLCVEKMLSLLAKRILKVFTNGILINDSPS